MTFQTVLRVSLKNACLNRKTFDVFSIETLTGLPDTSLQRSLWP